MIGDLWVETVISVKGIPWVGDGGVSGVLLSVVSSSDDKNGDIAGNGGIWSDDGSSDGSGSESDVDGCNKEIAGCISGVLVVVINGVVSGIVVGIVPNKITRSAGVPRLSSDESEVSSDNEISNKPAQAKFI
ncbi:hypothetical protein Tco_0910829 [Tanacetum coccineum]|uniref:Uncharacterized protein n=1 Tax=Tanacetum coccineum TaxID=301880 RepID=A0ABQ5D0B5_9ASTR